VPEPLGRTAYRGVAEHRILRVEARPEREEGHEGDPGGGARVEHGLGRPVEDVEGVLHTGDLGLRPGPVEVREGDVAQPDAADEPVMAGLDHGGELVVETL